MEMTQPKLITETNLSVAWAKAYLHVLDKPDDALVLAIRGFDGDLPPEDAIIAAALNSQLTICNIPRIVDTAFTIVPYEPWVRKGKPPLEELSKWYLEQILPRLKARCSKNRHGTYFQRLVAYTGVKEKNGKSEVRTVNQLSHIIQIWKSLAKKGKRPRQSALQLACFDPAKDHTGSALAGFPCLQQVSFTYHESNTLEVYGYYPTQYIFDRAYGNYLGLCQLGHLVAHALGAKLTRFTCFVARPELGAGGKAFHAKLAKMLHARVHEITVLPSDNQHPSPP